MKKILFLLIFLAYSFAGFSSHWVTINSPAPAPAKTQLVSSTVDRSVIHITLDGFSLAEINTPKGPANMVTVDKATPILESGAPDLPKITTSLIIPDLAEMSTRIIASSYRDFENIVVAPSKGVIMRDQDPATVPFLYGQSYETDKFYPGLITDTRTPYIIRDFRGQTVIVYPFQYNPVTKILRVYYDITVELYKSGETGVNPFYRTSSETRIHPEFRSVYYDQFLNPQAPTYTPLDEYGRLLIICHGAFMTAMQPYIDWKNSIGYPTEIVDVASIGTTASAIKTYISDYYNANNDLTFVLLVGDAPQIPTNQGGGLGGPSDNAYGYIVGNDHYADVFIGRFSAENIGHVETQVQRTIEYESDPVLRTDDWYTSVIGIASNLGPGDDNEYDYQHIRNQQTKMLNFTYTWNPEFFDGSQGGNDAAGNPNSTQVATAVNDGASLILYCGHGANTSWTTSGFNNSNVNALTNQGKLPFIWSVACVNGAFMTGTCFAEAWLRATKDGQPTGAIAFLGSTINQSWDSPMAGQDEMTDILVETYPTNIKRTFAGLSINGCMKMIDAYGNDGQNMADTWTVFGDPSITVRTANPDTLLVTHDPSLMVGDTSLTVYCNATGARVTVSLNDTILGTALIADSTSVITFPALQNAGDTLHLVVNGFNDIPYIAEIPVNATATVIASFTGFPTTLFEFDTVHFVDGSTGGASSWLWSFSGGNPSTSTEQNPAVVYENDGTYDVQLIAGNGTNYDTLIRYAYIHVDFPTSIGKESQTLTCSVTPNPGNGSFILNISNVQQDQVNIQVYNMVGNTVYQETNIPVNGSLKKNVNLTNLSQGIYFLKVKGSETTLTQKIMIQR